MDKFLHSLINVLKVVFKKSSPIENWELEDILQFSGDFLLVSAWQPSNWIVFVERGLVNEFPDIAC